MYSRLPFYLLSAQRRIQRPDAGNARLSLLRLGRCHHAEFLSETTDRTDLDKFVRRVTTVGMHRSLRAFLLRASGKTERRCFADYNQELAETLEQMQDEELEHLEEEAKPKPRFNADGEQMDPNDPQITWRKISCLPESQCNEVLEFDHTQGQDHG
jgi:hypothetical protein